MSAAPPADGGASDVRAFAAVSFAYFAFAGLFGTYAPLWFRSLGFTTLAIGTLTSMQSATRVFAPYVWGWWADHSGREQLLRVAVGGSLLASLGFFFARDYLARYGRVRQRGSLGFIGASFAVQHSACIALIARYFPGWIRGRGQVPYTVLG